MRTCSVFLALGICLLSTATQAATVSAVRGEVLVNKGDGYKAAAPTLEAAPGDLVMVKPNGSGRIVFPDGCVITVGPGVVSIAMKSPCERTGRLIETGGSLKDGPAPIAEEHRDVLPFMAVVGVAAGFILAPHKESPASP